MNQLVLKNSNEGNVPSNRIRDSFLKYIPINRIANQFKEEFKKENVSGPKEAISPKQLLKTLEGVSEWMQKHLNDGMFLHRLEVYVDKMHDYVYWEYNIEIKNAMVAFSIIEDIFDPFSQIGYQSKITPKNFVEYFNEQLFKGNMRIRKFNEKVIDAKPTLPEELPKREMLRHIMEETEKQMMPQIEKRYRFDPSEYTYDSWIIATGLERAKRFQLTKNGSAFIEYDIFMIPDDGWAIIEARLMLSGIGVKFLLIKNKISYYDIRTGQQIVNYYKHFIDNMESAIRNWNWLVKGGNKRKSRVKNQIPKQLMKRRKRR